MHTILIPTKDRSDFLTRLLSYYKALDWDGMIIIGDSSDGEHFSKAKEYINHAGKVLKIKHIDCKGMSIRQAHEKLLPHIETEYVCTITDGGFLVPGTINKCADFLRSHPDYGVASGKGLLVRTENDAVNGKICDITEYASMPSIEGETAAQRLTEELSDYGVTVYCVYRSRIWKEIWKESANIPNRSLSEEVMLCLLTAVAGKVKRLDDLYMVRQIHNRRTFLPMTFEWIISPQWHQAYNECVEVLSRGIARKDCVDQESAKEIVSKRFRAFLIRSLANELPRPVLKNNTILNNIKRGVRLVVKRRAQDGYENDLGFIKRSIEGGIK